MLEMLVRDFCLLMINFNVMLLASLIVSMIDTVCDSLIKCFDIVYGFNPFHF